MDQNDWKMLSPYLESVLGIQAVNEIKSNMNNAEAAARRCELAGDEGVLRRYSDIDHIFRYWINRANREGRSTLPIMDKIDGTWNYLEELLAETLVAHCDCKPITYKRPERPVAAGLVR